MSVVKGESMSLREEISLLAEHADKEVGEAKANRTVRSYIERIGSADRDKWLLFYDFHRELFESVAAGARHHHWWKGGLQDHCLEMLNLAEDIFGRYYNRFSSINFNDVILTVFLHDFAKIWWYRPITAEERAAKPDKFKEKQEFTSVEGCDRILDAEGRLAAYLMRWPGGLPISDTVWSAVVFAEGGFAKTNFSFGGTTRTSDTVFSSNKLATLVHCLDMISSQIWGNSIA